MIELLIIFITGICLITIAWRASEKKCPPPRIQYRFIPRTLTEEMENPVKVSDIFAGMFDNPDPYMYRTLGKKELKSEIRS